LHESPAVAPRPLACQKAGHDEPRLSALPRHLRMKEFIRRSLRRAGYDLHRFVPTSSPDAQLAQVLKTFGIDLVLDIGANTGQYGASLREIGYRGRIVSFEPLVTAWPALVAACAGDPRWTAAPRSAIGDHDGEITINIAGNSASSSVLPMLDSHRDAAPHSAYIGTDVVPIARLDSAAAAFTDDAARLFIKIDTQGYETQVLAGGPATIAAAAAVQVEMSLIPLYDGQPAFDAMLALMAGHGLVLWSLWPGFADPANGRILQAEGIFVRPERAI
jgi:FkbM family methyltransferase